MLGEVKPIFSFDTYTLKYVLLTLAFWVANDFFFSVFKVFLVAISKKTEEIYQEQQKSDLLLKKLLPPNVLPSLKNKEVLEEVKM